MKAIWEQAYKVGNTPWRENVGLAKYITGVPIGKALDLGCGTGEKSKELVDMGFKVTGIDFSPEALKSTEGIQGTFIEADLEKLKDLKLEHYDLVVDWKVHPFIKSKADYLQTIREHTDYYLIAVFTKHPKLQVAESDIKFITSVFTVQHEWRKIVSPTVETLVMLCR